MKKLNVNIVAGGGGGSSTGKSSLTGSQPAKLWMALSALSSRTCFGICQTIPVECNAGQMLKRVQHDTRGQAGSIRGLRACGHAAFTMAEILLSLTIIGVVAAITLPSLTGNINERTWNTQRKALYARFSQAIALMPALNGYGTLTAGDSSISAVDTAAETFITDGLSKVLKINNICDNDHLADCGIASQFTNLAGSVISPFPNTMGDLNSKLLFAGAIGHVGSNYSTLNTKAAAFETQNGESIVVYYNPNCTASVVSSAPYYTQPTMCANFVYDLNGSKGPNTVGKDIGFMSALYATDSSVVAPYPRVGDTLTGVSQPDGGRACNNLDNEYRLPNKDELASIFFNRSLIGISAGGYWSSTVFDINKAWRLSLDDGYLIPRDKTEDYNIRCVKR